MNLLIKGGTILAFERQIQNSCIFIENGVIKQVGGQPSDYVYDVCLDGDAYTIAPGLIDLHVHGAVGIDIMDGGAALYEKMGRFFASCGVTSYLPTVMSAASDTIEQIIDDYLAYTWRGDCARPIGLHLEGPYINPNKPGAMDVNTLRLPDAKEYGSWFEKGAVKLMTAAPELAGFEGLVTIGKETGVVFSMGHSTAGFDEARRAVDIGVLQTTHLFNVMAGLHHREPGIAGLSLVDERVSVQLIADGIHLHPVIVELVVRLKGSEGVILVTDGMAGMGLPNGEYRLGRERVWVKDGVALNAEGNLASSSLTMDQAVRNVIEYCDISLPEAITMAAATPANALGLQGKKGTLVAGADADIIFLDADNRVVLTMIDGQIAFDRR